MTTEQDETRPPHLLLVVAHPDDESFGCGSLLRYAAAAGLGTTVVCATRGEAGDAADGTPRSELAAVREAETRAAAAVLGVDTVEFLGFGDSGMSGTASATTLVGAPLEQVRDSIAAWIAKLHPSVVVTLDASDGRRDHERIREATLAAVEEVPGGVERVYLHCLPQSLMRRWVEHMAATDPSWEHLRAEVPGTPEELVTTVLDTSPFLADRERATALHASQRSPYTGLPDDLRRDFLTAERLRRVQPPWTGGPVESTLLPTAESQP